MSIRDLPRQHPLAQTCAAWLPDQSRQTYSWGLFRCEITLSDDCAASELFWSGSQRCTIWLNGERIADGPARSDRETWPWVTTALPALPAGTHCLAVEVHYSDTYGGKGQIGGPAFGSAMPATLPSQPGPVITLVGVAGAMRVAHRCLLSQRSAPKDIVLSAMD